MSELTAVSACYFVKKFDPAKMGAGDPRQQPTTTVVDVLKSGLHSLLGIPRAFRITSESLRDILTPRSAMISSDPPGIA